MGFEPRQPGVRARRAQALGCIPLTVFVWSGLRVGSPLPPAGGRQALPCDMMAPGRGVETAAGLPQAFEGGN